MDRPNAFVRGVAATFADAIASGGRPDHGLAVEEHRAYVAELEKAGYTVGWVPADDRHPDCVFIEDQAVILNGLAVMTRPGAAARRGESEAVEAVLRPWFPIRHLTEPAILDGGDVMVLGSTAYVGRSDRTDDEGIGQLRTITTERGLELVSIAVSGALHLKSVVLPVDEETVVVTPDCVDEALLRPLRIVHEDPRERLRFSALPIQDGRLLVTASAPRTAGILDSMGYRVQPLDVSQIQVADGGLTCLSILA